MTLRGILLLVYLTPLLVNAELHPNQKREAISNICSPVYNNTNKVVCSCEKDIHQTSRIKSADCYLAADASPDDPAWAAFRTLGDVDRLVLTSAKGIVLKYIPTKAFEYIQEIKKLDVKYNNIQKLQSFAFANSSALEELTLRDNQLAVLEVNAIAHHRNLTTINLDKNNIVEINREVFVDLPALEKLYLTSNNLTTLHDRAFVHLSSLRELEISSNRLFSLNSDTFSGLKKLQRLDLSGNSLEVIGDNTFLPLTELISLDLSANRIQMLDNKAFHGLSKLQFLSLAHNKITKIENNKVFESLKSLVSLSLKGNQIRDLKEEVMSPIITNFYNAPSNLDIEDNNLPCDCELDWLLILMYKIKNKQLRLSLENLKCDPSAELRDLWNRTQDAKATEQIVEENTQNADYEYYDDTQLDGKLFYIDVRDLLNCSTALPAESKATTVNGVSETTAVPNSPDATSASIVAARVSNTIDKTIELPEDKVNEKPKAKPDPYTTSRLATVSAKPIDRTHYDEQRMASDEAVPDKIKAHRSIQDMKETPNLNYNGGQRNIGCVYTFCSIILAFRLM